MANYSFDFGLYDLRSSNSVATRDSSAFDSYGLCFINYLPNATTTQLQALPVGVIEGDGSDYCK